MQATFSQVKTRRPEVGGSARQQPRPPLPGRVVRFLLSAIAESPAWMRRTLVLAVLALLATIGFTAVQAQGNVTQGLIIAGVPVGGLTYPEARQRLDARAAEFDQMQVTLRFEDHVWTPTLAELGVTMDVDAAWRMVQHFGSNQYAIHRLLRTLHLSSASFAVQVPLTIDQDALKQYCQDRMVELGKAPVDASLTVDGGSIQVTDDVGGFEISVDQLQADLVRELSGFTRPTVQLAAHYTTADVQRTEIQAHAAALDTALENPFTLYTETDQWQVEPSELARHITLEDSDGVPELTIDEDAVDALVASVADDIDREATEAYVSDAGTYARIVRAQDGYKVDRNDLRQRIYDSLLSGSNEVEIPVSITEVDDDIRPLLTEYGITDLIATGSSDFSGSDSRRDGNVRLAASRIDGTLVAPGDLFSFNQALGPIVEIDGFVPAGATEGGIPGDAVGGGVCQVSTSIFRAALQAGLPIEEWWPHVYRSIYYEQGGWAPGFDASIQQPDDDPLGGPDLVFRNTTEGWLLVRVTATSSSELKVSLFGTNPGFSVVISDPLYQDVVPSDQTAIEEVDETLEDGMVELWQPARDGVTMVVYRTVYASDGTLLIDESFVSSYQPQGPVYRVSPDMAGTTVAQQ